MLNRELDETVNLSIAHRIEKHTRSQGLVSTQDDHHDRHTKSLRDELDAMVLRGRAEKTAYDEVLARMRSRAEQALRDLKPRADLPAT